MADFFPRFLAPCDDHKNNQGGSMGGGKMWGVTTPRPQTPEANTPKPQQSGAPIVNAPKPSAMPKPQLSETPLSLSGGTVANQVSATHTHGGDAADASVTQTSQGPVGGGKLLDDGALIAVVVVSVLVGLLALFGLYRYCRRRPDPVADGKQVQPATPINDTTSTHSGAVSEPEAPEVEEVAPPTPTAPPASAVGVPATTPVLVV